MPTLIHLAETRDEVKTAQERFTPSPVAYLDSLGFWAPGVLAAHGVWVSEPDMALLKARGVGVSHNPESNMKLASGTAPVTGVPACRRGARARHRRRRQQQRSRHVRGDADGVAAAEAADATIRAPCQRADRARHGDHRRRPCAGMDEQIGSLEPGKRADLIVVSA